MKKAIQDELRRQTQIKTEDAAPIKRVVKQPDAPKPPKAGTVSNPAASGKGK